MTAKRFQWVYIKDNSLELRDNGIVKRFNNERLEELLNGLSEELNHELTVSKALRDVVRGLENENEQLKSQLCCDDEEGVCNICKHHYLIKDDETELGYYNSRCKKGHYECARVSLKYCEDFEKELEE